MLSNSAVAKSALLHTKLIAKYGARNETRIHILSKKYVGISASLLW